MHSSVSSATHKNVDGLAKAITSNQASDALVLSLSPAQWTTLSGFMQPFELAPDQILIERGSRDRTLFMVESGRLSVHYQDPEGTSRMTLLGEGAVIGEGSFFSHLPRLSSVHAVSVCRMWSITAMRFTELANRHPVIALALSMGLGTTIARRFVNGPKRIAVT